MINNYEQYFHINPNAFRFSPLLNKDSAISVHYFVIDRF